MPSSLKKQHLFAILASLLFLTLTVISHKPQTSIVSTIVSTVPSASWRTSQLAQVAPTTGLVTHWKFDEGSGTTAADSSGNGNGGTLVNGPTWVTGKVGGAIQFDGVDDAIELPRAMNITTPFSVQAWFKSTDSAGGIVMKYYNSSEFTYILRLNQGKVEFAPAIVAYRDPFPTRSSLTVNDNLWHQAVGVYDGSVAYLYVDGVLASSSPYTATVNDYSGYDHAIGYEGFNLANPLNSGFYQGAIDDVRIYSRALLPAEITDLYNYTDTTPPASTPPPTTTNQPPTASAGNSQTITLPSTATLVGIVSDDGLPSGSTLSTTWSKVSGTGTVTFSNQSSLNSTATFSEAGTYVLRLTASDSSLTSASDITITVNPIPVIELPPVVPPISTVSVGNGDSVLHLGGTGYASLINSAVSDLDYSKDFTVEAIIDIPSHTPGGRWADIVAKTDAAHSTNAGYSIGLNQGHFDTFGQIPYVKVGDGTNSINIDTVIYPGGNSAPTGYYQGITSIAMTWSASSKTVNLYVNGSLIKSKTNSSINPALIKNTYDLKLGGIHAYGSLGRDVLLARLWNRELSSSDISTLYTNFSTTGSHSVPSTVSKTDLKSEWLMQQASDAAGGVGTTHIKDTASSNNLKLMGGAIIHEGNGALATNYPANGAGGISPAVTLKASGGLLTLGASASKSLSYYFEIDESPSFNSGSQKNSGWLPNQGQWKPILKPSTSYYWRVRVRDGSNHESGYSSIATFSTRSRKDWYVRPGTYTGQLNDYLPTPTSGTYGSQNGTSYSNAWNGIREIVWGENGVAAGDNIYVCGKHIYNSGSVNFIGMQAIAYIKESGYSVDYPITIRMDCTNDPGTLWGAFQKDEGAVSSGSVSMLGFRFDLGRSSYIKFLNGNFVASPVGLERVTNTVTTIAPSHHIVFDNVTMKYIKGVSIPLNGGHNNWIIRNSDISFTNNAIYLSGFDTYNGLTGPQNILIENNKLHDIGTTGFGPPNDDCHAIGIQSGMGHVIQNNEIWNTGGSAVEFWTGSRPMKNMIVRYNYIHDTHVRCQTSSSGIVVSGDNSSVPGLRTGFKIYNNIVSNIATDYNLVDWHGGGISSNNVDPMDVYNNVVYNSIFGITFTVNGAYPASGNVLNNIIVSSRSRYIMMKGGSAPTNLQVDYNLFYPVTDTTDQAKFYLASTPVHDTHAVFADPKIVSTNPVVLSDFKLQANSPAINAGKSVGLTVDFAGVAIPQGSAPDIGAFEYGTGAVVTPVNGSCSTTLNTCTAGTFSDIADTTTNNLWSCLGSNGGTTAQCSSAKNVLDTTPPTISVISTSGITTTGATITFTTNEGGTTQIEYGLTTTYGNSTSLISTLVTSHTQSITSLSSNTTYHYRIISKDSSGNTTTSPDQTFTTLKPVVVLTPDVTPPTVSITLPTGGTVKDTVDISASASDPTSPTGQITSGLISVQFKLDNINLGPELTTPTSGTTYSGSWNTIGVTNGTHTLTVTARDAALNSKTSAGVTITVNNPVITPTESPTPSIAPEIQPTPVATPAIPQLTPIALSPNTPAVKPAITNSNTALKPTTTTKPYVGTFTPAVKQKPIKVKVQTSSTQTQANITDNINSTSTSNIDITVPKIPSWFDIIRLLIIDMAAQIRRGVQRTIVEIGGMF